MLEIFADAGLDSLKVFPFLLLTYILMEYLEHKTSEKTNIFVKKSGIFGPVAGALIGGFPQCGFSAAASNLYAGRVITIGTLIAIFLSTSDEMLPIMISEHCEISLIATILLNKIIIAMIVGVIVDYIAGSRKKELQAGIADLCEHEHCHCEKGIFKSALRHSLQILFFIFVVTLILNGVIAGVGEENLAFYVAKGNVISVFLSALVGLIPNCAASVVITELYIQGIISTGAMMAGLLVGSGVGVLVLFRMNKHLKENLIIIGLLYIVGVVFGFLYELLGITFI